MPPDPYKDLAGRYDLMRVSNPAREAFFRDLFARHNLNSVLDCACGTGHDLLLFHSLGCEVHGSDLSDSMLAQARKRIAESNLEIPILKSDFRNLPEHFKQRFDAVACLTNSINEVLEEDECIRALRSMRAVLRDGGVLVFDQGQSDASMKDPPRFVPIVNDRDFTRVFVIDYSGEQMEVNILDFIHSEMETDFKHVRVRIAIRLQDDWARLLGAAGFTEAEYYGRWDTEPYSKSASRRLIIVAQK